MNNVELFDLYCCRNEPRRLLTNDNSSGTRLWLDGIDEFFDQYFDGCADQIRFAVLSVDGSILIPGTRDDFESMPFIEARVTRREQTCGEVEIVSIDSFGQWANRIPLATESLLWELPALYRPSQDTLVALSEQAKPTGWAIWKSPQKYWRNLGDTSAICVFRGESDIRCVVLKTNAVPSALFRVSNNHVL